MTKYRFDWKDVIHGSIEIEANCGNDAEEILMNMSLKTCLKTPNIIQIKMREIRFADAGQFLENMDKEEWKQLKPHL